LEQQADSHMDTGDDSSTAHHRHTGQDDSWEGGEEKKAGEVAEAREVEDREG